MSIAEAIQKLQSTKEILDKLDQLNSKFIFMEMKKNCIEQTNETKLNRIEANINVIRKDIDVLLKEIRYSRVEHNKKTWLSKLWSIVKLDNIWMRHKR
jgi:hypothetical protein